MNDVTRDDQAGPAHPAPGDAKGASGHPPQIPIFATAKAAYRRTWNDRRGLLPLVPPTLTVGILASVVIVLLQHAFGDDSRLMSSGVPISRSAGAAMIALLFAIPAFVVGTMYAVAIHRRVLLGELSGWPMLRPSRRHLIFLTFTFGFWSISTLIYLMILLVTGNELTAGWINFPLIWVILYIEARLSVLLPAVAVDEFAGLNEAWALSTRNGWRILWVGVCVAAPFVVLGLVVTLMIHGGAPPDDPTLSDDLAVSVLGWITTTAMMLVQVSALSLIYARLTGRAVDA